MRPHDGQITCDPLATRVERLGHTRARVCVDQHDENEAWRKPITRANERQSEQAVQHTVVLVLVVDEAKLHGVKQSKAGRAAAYGGALEEGQEPAACNCVRAWPLRRSSSRTDGR